MGWKAHVSLKNFKLIRIPENPLYLLICHIIYSANRYCALNFSGDKLYPQKEHPSRELCREKSSHKLQLRIRGRLDFPRSQFVGSQMVLLLVNQLWLWSFPVSENNSDWKIQICNIFVNKIWLFAKKSNCCHYYSLLFGLFILFYEVFDNVDQLGCEVFSQGLQI